MTVDDGSPPPAGARLAFCLTLGWFSFAFAEISCGSTPSLFYPAFEFAWSLAVTWPLYMSHCVLILTALVRARRACGWVTVPPVCLWLGGQLFGLYESWITKVLFRPTFSGFPTCGLVSTGSSSGSDGTSASPTSDSPLDLHNATISAAYCGSLANRTDWGPLPGAPVHEDPACGLYLGGIAAPQFATLIFYYHPTWSFIVPCLVCERLLCRTVPADGRYMLVPSSVLPGCLHHCQRVARRGTNSCCRNAWSIKCCCQWMLGIGGFLLGLLLLLAKFAGTKVDDYIVAGMLGVLLLCAVAFCLIVPLLSAKQKWPMLTVLFGVYTGLSGVNDNLVQAVTTAPTAALISVWLIEKGRKPLQGRQMYTLEQLLPVGWELVGWVAVLGGIYVSTGLGLSTQCLPLFTGGPLAVLLCYLVLFLLLVLHLHRAEDRCDKAGYESTGDSHVVSTSSSSDRTNINTPILQHSSTVIAGADEVPSFPQIQWRWKHGICIAAVVSATITVLCKLLPGLGAVGSTLVILGIDWSGVALGLLYFLTKALGGGMRLLLRPARTTVTTDNCGDTRAATGSNDAFYSCGPIGIMVALFSAILVPALLANGAVEMLPQLRTAAMAPAILVGSVVLAMVQTIVGLCCICRGRMK